MPIANYTTTVTVSKSVDVISKLLAKNGVRAIQTEFTHDGMASGLSFIIDTEYGPRTFALPVRAEGVLNALVRQKVEPRYRTFEHANRVAWRIAHEWLRAQLALIDAGMSSTSEVFFPYLVTTLDADMRPVTVFSEYTRSQREIER